MKTMLTLLVILFTVISSNAQQWYQVTSNTTERLKDIVMVSTSMGFCSGGGDIYNSPDGNGVILKTTDGGENWTTVYSQSNLAIYSVNSINNQLYAFAKDNGANKLLQSSDDGANWTVSDFSYNPYNVQNTNNAIYFMDADDNYNLIKWTPTSVQTLMTNVGLYGINNSEIVCINIGFNTLYKSTDGGVNFTMLTGYPTEFSQNQSTNAVIKSFGSTLVVHYTYPAATQVSYDNGSTWTHMGYDGDNGSMYANYSEIIAANVLLGSFSSTLTTQIDFQPWETEATLTSTIRNIYVFSGTLGFTLGDNGMIYKTTNVDGLSTPNYQLTDEDISIATNNTNNQILITNTENLTVHSVMLFDMQGKVVNTYLQNLNQIDTSNLSKGTYIVLVATAGKNYTKKVVIQ